jgi:hypothetical protein
MRIARDAALAHKRIRGRRGYCGGEDEEDVDGEGEGEGVASSRGSFREGTFTSRWYSA